MTRSTIELFERANERAEARIEVANVMCSRLVFLLMLHACALILQELFDLELRYWVAGTTLGVVVGAYTYRSGLRRYQRTLNSTKLKLSDLYGFDSEPCDIDSRN